MSDFGSGLRRFSDMDDVQVAKDDPDVRGWDVLTRDGRDIGEVKDLLVDTDAMKVRALEVELDGEAFHAKNNRRVVLPVDGVDIDEEKDDVIVNSMAFDEIATLPEYSSGETRRVERVSHDVPVQRERVRIERRPVTGESVRGDEGERGHGPKGDY